MSSNGDCARLPRGAPLVEKRPCDGAVFAIAGVSGDSYDISRPAVALHLMSDAALADPVNQREVREHCESYPSARLGRNCDAAACCGSPGPVACHHLEAADRGLRQGVASVRVALRRGQRRSADSVVAAGGLRDESVDPPGIRRAVGVREDQRATVGRQLPQPYIGHAPTMTNSVHNGTLVRIRCEHTHGTAPEHRHMPQPRWPQAMCIRAAPRPTLSVQPIRSHHRRHLVRQVAPIQTVTHPVHPTTQVSSNSSRRIRQPDARVSAPTCHFGHLASASP